MKVYAIGAACFIGGAIAMHLYMRRNTPNPIVPTPGDSLRSVTREDPRTPAEIAMSQRLGYYVGPGSTIRGGR